MDYFKGNKYQSIHENIPYIASKVYNILFKAKKFENILDDYINIHKMSKSINIERNVKMAITFLYSIGKVDYDGNIIKRVE
ncbi:hypothetical protein ACTFIN_09650 [Clostridium cagae]|uniref:hypothetical protein n=1 Tax=Clostridium TaxID=1485 RepID=UPI0020796F4A|nr:MULTISPECIES: hypothetical protein [unclassified Clostridium]